MKRILLFVIVSSAMLLTACGAVVAAAPAPTEVPAFATQPLALPTTAAAPAEDLTRVDEQGMVIVELTPLNLQADSQTLDFEVAMNTHSVNLNMDLASLSRLTTDTGVSVQAVSWDGPPGGGHHVRGTLRFPAVQDGKPLLAGTTTLTITIRDLDAPQRVFEWNLH